MSIPYVQPHAWPSDLPASRLARGFSRLPVVGSDLTLLGVPDDTGVGLNHGRLGAAEGPSAVRAALARYGTAEPGGFDWPEVADAGDVVPADELSVTHDRVTAAAGAILDAGSVPVMIGGGHDLTYPFVRALCERLESPPTGIYLDAHLDVRAEEGSGMPFRSLIERCGVRSLYVHGLDPFANSAEHTAWFSAHGGRIGGFEPEDPWPEGDLFVSFDLDVIDQAYAPGVSAMNPSGWNPALAERWARAAGRCPRVRCFDLMELSPPHDIGGRTARLAARLLLAFFRGYAERR